MARSKTRRSKKEDPTILIIGITYSLMALFFIFIAIRLFYKYVWLTYSGFVVSLIVLIVIISIAMIVFIKIWPRWIQLRRYRALKLDDVDSMPGHEFEHYVARLMEHHGFKTTVTKGSGDLGVDIIAHKESFSYTVQCKRYNDNISRTAVSDAVAGKQHYRCTHAMVVTNRYFTTGATELAKSTECILIDRDRLAIWVENFQRNGNEKELC